MTETTCSILDFESAAAPTVMLDADDWKQMCEWANKGQSDPKFGRDGRPIVLRCVRFEHKVGV